METLREQIANTCIYFTGIQNEFCNANVRYESIRDIHGKGSELPCISGSDTCIEGRFPTDDEVVAKIATIDKLFDEVVNDLKNDICPECKQKVEKRRQVGRCVYADPCGHRLYQGKA